MVPFIFKTVILYLHIPFQIPDLVMYFSNLCFVFVKISRLPLGGDIYIFSIELKALKHFSISALLYFKLDSFYGCTILHCVCSYMNKNYMWRTILQNRIQFVEERALN